MTYFLKIIPVLKNNNYSRPILDLFLIFFGLFYVKLFPLQFMSISGPYLSKAKMFWKSMHFEKSITRWLCKIGGNEVNHLNKFKVLLQDLGQYFGTPKTEKLVLFSHDFTSFQCSFADQYLQWKVWRNNKSLLWSQQNLYLRS